MLILSFLNLLFEVNASSFSSPAVEQDFNNEIIVKEFFQLVENDRFDELHSPESIWTLKRAPEESGQGAFAKHVSDAIILNENRKDFYSRLSGGKSIPISKYLIRLEKAAKISAWFIDRWSRRFNLQGIPIIKDDFVAMDGVKTPESAPFYREKIKPETEKRFKKFLMNFRNEIIDKIRKANFLEIAQQCYFGLRRIKDIESTENCHLALTSHLFESIGFGALHSYAYSRQTNGKTAKLSKCFLFLQILPLTGCFSWDLKAQEIHQMGVGIIVNDVPQIPFEKEWEAQFKPAPNWKDKK